MNLTLVLIIFLAIVFFYAISLYNWFQTALTRMSASIQDIGNQLKRQASLIPNLEQSTKAYLKHEKGIYDSIVSARKAVEKASNSKDIAKIETASDAVSSLIPKLQVLVESNPEMKGAEVISKFMDELRDTSDKLMYARRVVIDLTADFNSKVVTVPSNIVAKMFGFHAQKGLVTSENGAHLTVSEEETVDPKISL